MTMLYIEATSDVVIYLQMRYLFMDDTNFVARHCTLSTACASNLTRGYHMMLPYSRCGHTIAWYTPGSVYSSRHQNVALIRPSRRNSVCQLSSYHLVSVIHLISGYHPYTVLFSICCYSNARKLFSSLYKVGRLVGSAHFSVILLSHSQRMIQFAYTVTKLDTFSNV